MIDKSLRVLFLLDFYVFLKRTFGAVSAETHYRINVNPGKVHIRATTAPRRVRFYQFIFFVNFCYPFAASCDCNCNFIVDIRQFSEQFQILIQVRIAHKFGQNIAPVFQNLTYNPMNWNYYFCACFAGALCNKFIAAFQIFNSRIIAVSHCRKRSYQKPVLIVV